MKKSKQLLKLCTAMLLSLSMVASNIAGVIPQITGKKVSTEVEVQAASSVLSNEERGVIYANSRTDFRDETIYFLITTRFYDGDPSNNARTSEDKKAQNPEDDPSWRGDFAGLIEKLDYIKALGFTAIWITPVVQNDSGYDYHGYHAYNFSAVDYRYESNGITYQDLINAVHAKGMKIIQDVVFNHTCNWGEENLLKITSDVYSERNQVVMNGKGDTENIYHHNGFCGGGDWDNYSAQNKTIADDCFDLETENPLVTDYLVDCYKKYINMGVDAFRVDTVKHISRLTFNTAILPELKKAGGEDFYMFGEVCTKGYDVWYRDCPPISTCFYTWDDDSTWKNRWSNSVSSNEALVEEHYAYYNNAGVQPTSDNAFLKGNEYHTPDYSKKSDMDVIDFQMHWSFNSAGGAFNTAKGQDKYFNDSTWNVVYVDSHDYAPDNCQTVRYTGGTDAWAENLSLMFTFRGIPCLYYGSEIEFQKGMPIDRGPNSPLSETGRAYYGDHIEGTVETSDFTVFGNLSGEVKNTLNSTLSQHIMRLNRIRQAVPALRKGQYSTEGCSGNMAFKRRYTDSKTDSFALVTISGGATFSGIPNGKYVDCVTGDVKNVTNGTLTASVSGQGNMRVYVLDTAKTPAPGRVITNGDYLTDGGAAELIGEAEINTVKPTSITLNKSSVSIMEGKTATVTASVLPSNASQIVSWTTSNSSVATVSGGTITAVSTGSATITAKTVNGLTSTVKVTVTANPDIVYPTGVTISQSSIELEEGNTTTLTASVLPANATNKTVTWTSSDDSVAEVNNSGLVTAKSEGTATITAKTSNGKTASVSVKVTGKAFKYLENGVYFENTSNWNDVYVYMWNGSNQIMGGWPGTKIEEISDNIYGFSTTAEEGDTMIIFNCGSDSAKTGDLVFKKNGYYNPSGLQKIVNPVVNGKVYVNYVDENGTVLSSKSMSGEVGASYTTSAMTFDGYTLKTKPSNASGTYTSADITVTYIYAKNEIYTELKATIKTNNANPSVGDTITLTAGASGGSGSYTYSFLINNPSTKEWYRYNSTFKAGNTQTWKVAGTGTRKFYAEVKDSTGKVVRSSAVTITIKEEVTSPLSITASASNTNPAVGTSTTITAKASGGSGSYKYSFLINNPSTKEWYRYNSTFKTGNTQTWKAAGTGTRKFYAEVKDSTGKVVRSSAVTVKVQSSQTSPLSVKATTNAWLVNKGASVTIKGTASGGSGSYTYSYLIYSVEGKTWYRFNKTFKTSNTHIWKATTTGNKKFYVEVKDSTGKVVRSAAADVLVQ